MSENSNIDNILGTVGCAVMVLFLATVVPYVIITAENHTVIPELDKFRNIGPILILLGVIGYLMCFWNFINDAKGNPNPGADQTYLMVRGLYGYVRNPMYIAWYSILLGESLIFQSQDILFYLLFWIIFFYLKVVLFEEPYLRDKFGDSYKQYCKSVRRWIPRIKAYDANIKE